MLTQNNGFDHMGYNSLIALPTLLSSVRYSPCNNKKYYLQKWHSSPKPLSYCQAEITAGKANGYGLITGEIDGLGIVVLDFDGVGSDDLANNISPSLLDDNTLAWSSGKEGHHSRAFIIPKPHLPFWSGVMKHVIFPDSGNINSPHLEIRYNAHASVIPPSAHPETKCYKWLYDKGVRSLTFNESYALLDKCTISTNDDLTGEQELNLIEEALSFIPSDDYHVWVTVGMALYRQGMDFSVWDNWSAQSAKYNNKGMDKKWQSFSKANRVNIGTLFHLASTNGFDQKRWMRENLKRQRQALNHTIKNDPTEPKEISKNEIIKLTNQLIIRLSDPAINEADRDQQILDFCYQYKVSDTPIRKAIKSRMERDNTIDEIEQRLPHIDELMAVPKITLNLPYLLGDYLAEELVTASAKIPTNPDAVFTVMLPTIASLIGTKGRIIVDPSTRYIVPFILRTMIVANSGERKSPTARLAVDPLYDYDRAEYDNYQREKAVWEQLNKDEQGNPPKLNTYLVSDSTIDGLLRVHSESPRGFLCYVDELYGYFKRMNKFNNSGGDDVQRDLELFEGKAMKKTRADNTKDIYLPRTAISITGTIQEIVLNRILNNDDDLTGISARWIIWNGEMPLGKAKRRSGENSTNFSDVLDSLYRNILTLPENDLLISDEAYNDVFVDWQNDIMEAIRGLGLPQLESKYNKVEAEAIKLAGIMHYISYLTGGETNPLVISPESMQKGIYLANYYLKHYCYVLYKSKEDLIEGGVIKILKLLEKKGEITAQDAKRNIRELREKTITEVTELMETLCKKGKATRIPTNKGCRIKLV